MDPVYVSAPCNANGIQTDAGLGIEVRVSSE
jgi:hypothetical protein